VVDFEIEIKDAEDEAILKMEELFTELARKCAEARAQGPAKEGEMESSDR